MEATVEPSGDRLSDGNESPSAPSEYLAEFLSAIMRRQYAEALKYCRLILQYEPHNATARGFHPLLLQKLREHRGAAATVGGACGACSASSGSEAGSSMDSDHSEQEEDASSSSLGLDSEGSASAELSRRTDSASASCSGQSAARGESSRSDADDNGNVPCLTPSTKDEDVENDNASGDGGASFGVGLAPVGDAYKPAHLKGVVQGAPAVAATPLQRLRAQFACSIK